MILHNLVRSSEWHYFALPRIKNLSRPHIFSSLCIVSSDLFNMLLIFASFSYQSLSIERSIFHILMGMDCVWMSNWLL